METHKWKARTAKITSTNRTSTPEYFYALYYVRAIFSKENETLGEENQFYNKNYKEKK